MQRSKRRSAWHEGVGINIDDGEIELRSIAESSRCDREIFVPCSEDGGESDTSGNQFLDHSAVDVRQTKIPSRIPICKFLVVEPHQLHDGRL